MRQIITAVLLLMLTAGCSRYPIKEQVRALGNHEFTPEKWAVATAVERERMLASFFAKYPADKLAARQVREVLGEPTAYYDYDENLAYFVGPANVESEYGKERMLVFITDKRTGKIDEIELVPPLR